MGPVPMIVVRVPVIINEVIARHKLCPGQVRGLAVDFKVFKGRPRIQNGDRHICACAEIPGPGHLDRLHIPLKTEERVIGGKA